MPLDPLDQIARQADSGLQAVDNPGADEQGENSQVQEQGPDYLTAAAGAVDFFAAAATGWAPEVGPLWNDQTKANIAGTLAPVLEKYKLDMGALPPEVLFIVTAGPVLWQTAKIIKAKAEAERPKQVANEQRPNVQPPKATQVGPEVERHPQESLYK